MFHPGISQRGRDQVFAGQKCIYLPSLIFSPIIEIPQPAVLRKVGLEKAKTNLKYSYKGQKGHIYYVFLRTFISKFSFSF